MCQIILLDAVKWVTQIWALWQNKSTPWSETAKEIIFFRERDRNFYASLQIVTKTRPQSTRARGADPASKYEYNQSKP